MLFNVEKIWKESWGDVSPCLRQVCVRGMRHVQVVVLYREIGNLTYRRILNLCLLLHAPACAGGHFAYGSKLGGYASVG